MDLMTPCNRCRQAREALDVFLEQYADAAGVQLLSAGQPVTGMEFNLRCQLCGTAGYLLTADGERLAALLADRHANR